LPIFPRQQFRLFSIFGRELVYACGSGRKTLLADPSRTVFRARRASKNGRFNMLQRNPLQPPRPFVPPAAAAEARPPRACGFLSAEDFDATGVLPGVDPCESRYWWMPELYGPESAAGTETAGRDQATRRSASRVTAAA